MSAYWLMKSEPGTYSIDDLKSDKKTAWDGVRNYQARNFMRDRMKIGDLVLFYHSNAEPPGVAGVARVCKAGYPDPKEPTWSLVDIEFIEKFSSFIPLETLKANQHILKGMGVIQKGSRLSVQPVEKEHFEWVRRCGRK